MIDIVGIAMLIVIDLAIIALSVSHMNAMHNGHRTWTEIIAWWCIGVGGFSECVAAVTEFDHEVFSEALFAFGALMLIVIHTQPEWRPIFSDRRKELQPPRPDGCYHRCTRSTDRKEPAS